MFRKLLSYIKCVYIYIYISTNYSIVIPKAILQLCIKIFISAYYRLVLHVKVKKIHRYS